jgi:epoxyqueuosine reductase
VYFNEQIEKILRENFIDYIGFADLKSYQAELVKSGGSILSGYYCGISIGIDIPDSIVDFLPQRENNNFSSEYRIHGYDVLNLRLNDIASKLSSYLNHQGYRTIPIAVADRTDNANGLSILSHKMIAHIAGLGWIGKNCLLITPQHGPRVRFISVLTDAPLKTVNKPLDSKCNQCMECVKICPSGAIKGKNYKIGEDRDERLDFAKCNNYFEKIKKEMIYGVCGMCLYVCPYGKKH